MRKWWYVALSVLLLAPVYWQPRVQAGDLSSHIYNAWLTQVIETGRSQGLVVVSQTTNILFDAMLGGLFRLFGAEAAQRIAVSVAVLVFVWGAFRFVSAVGGQPAWHLLPCIAMLAYGWVFHMGFFNFYLSMGLCLWVLAAVWEWRPRRVVIAVPLLLLAYTAHALPVVWVVGLTLYQWLARRISPRARVYVTAGSLLGMVLLQVVVGHTMFSRWSAQQIKMATGADQVWVFDGKYYVILVGLVFLWGMLFLDLLKASGLRNVVSSLAFQFCVISAAAVSILPTTILLPGFHHSLVYIAERMSLGVGICVCALLATARPRAFERYALTLVAVVFFGFLYRDERVLNVIEDRMDDVMTQLPASQRVVNGVGDIDLHRAVSVASNIGLPPRGAYAQGPKVLFAVLSLLPADSLVSAAAASRLPDCQYHHQVPHHQTTIPIRNPADDVAFVHIHAEGADAKRERFRGDQPRGRSGMHHQTNERTPFRRSQSKAEQCGE